nr:iron-containing alcohol dehydrogenase [Klebsiella variicola]
MISGSSAIPALEPLLNDKRNVLVLTDQNIVRLHATGQILALMAKSGCSVEVVDNVPPEPSYHDVEKVLSRVDGKTFDLVVGIGGGSVLDVAKLLSVLCHSSAPTVRELLDGKKIEARQPSLLIPATAGTGSESTPNAIVAVPEKNIKVGIISPVMLPDYVALLPELTTSMPAQIASSTGIDALCHLLECFTATCANPVSDNVALMGLHKLFRNLEKAVVEPTNLTAKLEMLWASYYGGAAIAHAGTHLVHALSYPLGGTYHLPHGVANAILLAPCMKVVRPYSVEKFSRVWDLIPGVDLSLDPETKSHALVDYLAALVKRLNLPDNLETLGVPSTDIDVLSEAALNVKRLMNNAPCVLKHEEVVAIYRTLFPKI